MFELTLATILFSISFGLIKSQIASLDTFLVVLLRMLFACIIFLPIFLLKRKNITKNNFILAFLIGMFEFGAMYVLYISAYKYLKGSEIALLTTSTPIFVMIFGYIFSKKINLHEILFVLLSVLGSLFIVFKENNLNMALFGIIFMELSNIVFALGQIVWKKYVNLNTPEIMFPAYLGGICFPLIFVLLFTDFNSFHINLLQVSSIIYLGTIPTGLGFYLWNKGVKKVKESTLASINSLKIPMGVLFAILIFGENINFKTFAFGFSLVIIGIIGTLAHKPKL